MSKLGDLFIHLGVKKDNLTKGLDSAKKEVNGFGQTLGKMKAGAVALWATVGAVALKAADNFAHTSQRFGDAWDNTTARMKAAWDTFTTALTNWDWEGFGKRMRNAMSGAGIAQAYEDQMGEAMDALKLKKAMLAEELEADRIAMRNQNLSYEERKKAAERYLAKMKPLYEEEARIYGGYMQTQAGAFLSQAGVLNTNTSRQNLQSFLTSVVNNPAMLEALDRQARGKASAGDNSLVATLGLSGQTLADFQGMAKAYQGGTNDAERKKLVDSFVLAANAAGAFDRETRMVQTTLNALNAKVDTHSGASEKDTEATERNAEAVAMLGEKLEKVNDIMGKAHDNSGLAGGVAINQDAIDARVDAFMRYQEAAEDLAYSLEDGLISALDELANAFAGVSGADFGSVIKALLTPLADAAVRAGLLVMTTGKALETLKEGFVNLFGGGPHAAIVAGAALMGLGVAAKAGLAAIGSGSSATGVATSGATAANTATQTAYEDMNINVRIEGKLKGSDIVLAARGAEASWAR